MSKTLLFEKTNDMLLAVYYTYDYPEFESILFKQLETNGSYRLKNTFCITYDSIVDCDDEECVCFKIGSLDNGYYKLDSEMFNLENNFYFDESFNFKKTIL
ncbi:hypothetical protein NIT60_05000 [Mammaliicoccus sciuri]|nr:hypothetical protein NIT60_05000 [Mammaliicoccus sciuri]